MKVERKIIEPTFVPIVITIETREEAVELWHRLNCSIWKSFNQHGKEKGYEPSPVINGMWTKLDEFFHP